MNICRMTAQKQQQHMQQQQQYMHSSQLVALHIWCWLAALCAAGNGRALQTDPLSPTVDLEGLLHPTSHIRLSAELQSNHAACHCKRLVEEVTARRATATACSLTPMCSSRPPGESASTRIMSPSSIVSRSLLTCCLATQVNSMHWATGSQ